MEEKLKKKAEDNISEQKEETGTTKAEEKKGKSVEEIIAEKLAEKEKEWNAETDRRVNQALEKEKKRAALSEEEKLKEVQKERQAELEAKEAELNLKTAKIDILEKLRGFELLDAAPLFKAENYVGKNSANIEKDVKALQDFIKKEIEKGIQSEKETLLSGGAKPGQKSTKQGQITAEEFNKMTYREKVQLFNDNPELYKALTK